MAYGILKCDTVTFTNDGVDKSVTLSGLVQNPTFSGNVTVTGTLSGVTVTGTTANFTSGNFTNISGGTHTITSGVFATGSAASPSITFTGDLNTGIYSPGADQVAISTGGSGRLFVDASGRLGVGTSSPSFPIESKVTGLDSTIWGYNVAQFADATANNTGLRIGTNTSTSGLTQLIAATNSAASQFGFWTYNGSAWGERMRLDSSGRLGVGTSSPSDPLHIAVSGANSANIRLQSGDGRTYNVGSTGSGYGSSGKFIIYDITAGAERFCINSSGSVGIGTTSPSQLLHIQGASSPAFLSLDTRNNVNAYMFAGNTEAVFGAGSAHPVTFRVTDLERARIDTSGRLLVGTSSSTTTGDGQYALLQIRANTAASTGGGIISLQRGESATSITTDEPIGTIVFADNTGNEFGRIIAFADANAGTNDYPGRLVFSTTADGASSPTERMRINSEGRIFVNSTSTVFTPTCTQGAGTSFSLIVGKHSATNGSQDTGTTSFIVYTNGNVVNTNNSYGAISDAKLKENIVDATSQWSDIKALQVRKYNFKEGQTHTQIGLIAQEVELVSPGLVSESPDRDEDGNALGTVTKSVNYSVLYMKAVKALQEAMERIETLEAKVAALEA